MNLRIVSFVSRLVFGALLPLSSGSVALRAAVAWENASIAEITQIAALSAEQITALEPAYAEYRKERSALEKEVPSAETKAMRRALVRQMEAAMRKLHAEVATILSEEQLKQLAAVPLRENPPSGARPGDGASEEFLATLRLSNEQRMQMEALFAVYQPQIQVLIGELKEAEGMRSQRKIAKPLKALREEMDEAVESILDKKQYATWESRMEENKSSMREMLKRD